MVSYTVDNPGFGYVSTASVTVAQPGIVSLSPVYSGSGYSATTVPQVSISGGGGANATATAVIGTGSEAGKIISYNITAPGSGYTSTGVGNAYLLGPITNTGLVTTSNYTTFAGTNSGYTTTGAAVPVTITGSGLVTTVNYTTFGGMNSGYTSGTAQPVTITGGTGVGAAGTAIIVGGVIQSVTLTNSGSGYVNGTSYVISDGIHTTATLTAIVDNAKGTAIISGGSIQSVTLTSSGSSYFNGQSYTIVGGGGSTATLTASVIPTSGLAKTVYRVTNAGTLYPNGSAVPITITGATGSTPATGTANIVGGVIQSITITSPGSGYINGQPYGIAATTGSGGTFIGKVVNIPTSGQFAVSLTSQDPAFPIVRKALGTATTDSNGSVINISIDNNSIGSGYNTSTVYNVNYFETFNGLTLETDIGDAKVTLNKIVITVKDPGIASISLPNGLPSGSGYGATAPSIFLAGGGGSQATGTAVLGSGSTSGQVVSYNVTSPGSLYNTDLNTSFYTDLTLPVSSYLISGGSNYSVRSATGVVTLADTAGLFTLPVTITGGTGLVATGNARVSAGVITGLALTLSLIHI